jgi:hypothetical protein
MRWYTALLWGWMVMAFLTSPIMGPLHDSRTPETVAAIARIPNFASQADFQNLIGIVLGWNLTRTNPLLLVLAPVWLAAAMAFLMRFDRRWWVVLLIVVVWGALDNGRNALDFLRQYYPVSNDPANFENLPVFLPAVLILLARRFNLAERWAYPLAGVLFSLLIWLTWGVSPADTVLVLLAAPAADIGWRVGVYLFGVVDSPRSGKQLQFLFLAGLLLPVFTGAIDLYLRSNPSGSIP